MGWKIEDSVRSVNSPLPGKIIQIKVRPGDTVELDDVLVVLEAMKMDNDIASPFNGTVEEVSVVTGQTVAKGQVLVLIGRVQK